MNCTEIAPLLEDLLGGEIPEEAEASVRGHLAGCPGCRRAWEWMCVTREAFQALPPERPRGGFEDRLGQILGMEIAPVRPLAPHAPLPAPPDGFLCRSLALCRQPGVQWALAASFLAAALGGGFYLRTPLPAGIGVPAAPPVTEARPLDPRPAPRDQVRIPVPIAAPTRPAAPATAPPALERRASLAPAAIGTKARMRYTRPAVPAGPPAPAAPEAEILAEADLAGLDAPPMLGYVRAQDLPSPLRCQMGGSWPDCRPSTPCLAADGCGAADAATATTTD